MEVHTNGGKHKKIKVRNEYGSFRIDPLLAKEKQALVRPAEYEKSGYAQGHLANSKDFSFNKDANAATYVISNIAPQ